MTKTQKATIVLLSLAALALAAAAVFITLSAYVQWSRRPLGAALPSSVYMQLDLPATWTPSPVPAGVVTARTAEPTAAPKGPLCGGPPLMNLLLIGSDTRGAGYTWGLSDVMRIARVDFTTPAVTVLDFPRDLWVYIPEIADNLKGQDHEKLNQAYLYGNPGDGFKYWDNPSAGPGLLARTLDLNFGARVDHYIAVNMQTFVRVVDAIGGLDVTLNKPVAGSHKPELQSGTHHLDGAEALAVARDRSEGVFSRGEEQNLVLCALQKKLTSASVIPHIPDLIGTFRNSVQTDLSPVLMSQLACLATQMPRPSIALYSFPETVFTGTRVYDPVFQKSVFIWDADFLVLRDYVSKFQAGSWPDAGSGTAAAGGRSFCP